MENRILFSVCLSVYHNDRPQWFCEAVESILTQTVKPDEIILVVDGPVSEELDVCIRDYEQKNLIKVVRLEKNQGLGTARRVAMSHCRNNLVAMMDTDDISVPDRFEKQLAVFADDSDVAIVGGQIAEFIESPEKPIGLRKVHTEDAQIKHDLKNRCPFNHVTVMVKKDAVDQVGGYLDWLYNEDYYLWIRMYLAGMKFANVPEILVNVRVGEDMYQRRGGWIYFSSELKLQNFMLKNRVIGIPAYLMNVTKRMIVQLLLPCKLRSWVFQTFARE